VNYGIRPIGALLGGALGTAIGLHTTLWIGVVGALAGVICVELAGEGEVLRIAQIVRCRERELGSPLPDD
jgi:hypothetical protein